VDLGQRRELNNGFGNAMARAFELVLTPTIFGFLGYLLDGWLGTRPAFMLGFFLFVVLYEFWKMFTGYDAAMREQESKLPGRRDAQGGRL
jgi:F0F1-type ATP synthase assembly protein I